MFDAKLVILAMYSDLEPDAMAAGMDAFITKGKACEAVMPIFEAIADCQGK